MAGTTNFFPVARTSLLTSLDRITQRATDFIRGNPIVSTAAIGIGTTGLIAGVASVARKRKKKRTTKKRKAKRRAPTRKRKTAKRRTKKRRIIRGRGLGTHEIRHSGKKTKGKFKVVSFRNKKTGKMVRFKVKK